MFTTLAQNVGKDVDQKELSCAVGGSMTRYKLGKQFGKGGSYSLI